ncbi:hypothetical protein VTK73DRAFT_3564 [Phialemonium thermophilum]|uniref:Uncharacterized protein n=1 Tax=Phialemonium thermophilum TaxID=223376 RepID=A0ABR3VHR8_9PEZI
MSLLVRVMVPATEEMMLVVLGVVYVPWPLRSRPVSRGGGGERRKSTVAESGFVYLIHWGSSVMTSPGVTMSYWSSLRTRLAGRIRTSPSSSTPPLLESESDSSSSLRPKYLGTGFGAMIVMGMAQRGERIGVVLAWACSVALRRRLCLSLVLGRSPVLYVLLPLRREKRRL